MRPINTIEEIESDCCPICGSEVVVITIAGPRLIRIAPCGHDYDPVRDEEAGVRFLPSVMSSILRLLGPEDLRLDG